MTAKEALKDLEKRNEALKKEGHFHIGEITMNIIKQALEELEAIKSADGGKAMEALNSMRKYNMTTDLYRIEKYNDNSRIVENYILKSQAQERELAELKVKIQRYIKLSIMVQKSYVNLLQGKENETVDFTDKQAVEFPLLEDELLNLCKGSEE